MPAPPLPELVRTRALAEGANAWPDELPMLVADLEHEWAITVGRPYEGGSEALVAEATLADGTRAVLKLLIPRSDGSAAHEITALRLANGEGCARLLRGDVARSAMLLERLGPTLASRGLPTEQRLDILREAAALVWRPAPDSGLPTGAAKARWLIDFITRTWQELDRPCTERAIDYAVACANHHLAAHDDERAVLVHGDVHEWNALAAGDGYKLVDPDGLLAEAEYDLGVLIRQDPPESIARETRARAARLAERTGLDAVAIWEWGSSNGSRADWCAPASTSSPVGARCWRRPTSRRATGTRARGNR